MRAYSDNEDLALLSGIDPKKIILLTWVIVSILATIAGTLYGLDKSFKPFTYFNNLLPIFAATIVGGIGNPLGAFYGGFLIAFSEIALTYAYKKFFKYLLGNVWLKDPHGRIAPVDCVCPLCTAAVVITFLPTPCIWLVVVAVDVLVKLQSDSPNHGFVATVSPSQTS